MTGLAATSPACCPTAECVSVGTASGHIYFIDLTQKELPCPVHRVHLYRVPVEHLQYDQGGSFLISEASDSHVFVLDARPSKMFEVIRYTEAAGSVVDLSSLYNKDSKQVNVLVLSAGNKENCVKEGSCLEIFMLQAQLLKEYTKTTDKLHMGNTVCLQLLLYLNARSIRNKEATVLVCDYDIEKVLQLQSHSSRLSGPVALAFSLDSQTLLTTGLRDGALVCVQFRFKTGAMTKASIASDYGQSVEGLLGTSVLTETAALRELPEWAAPSQTPPGSALWEQQEEEDVEIVFFAFQLLYQSTLIVPLSWPRLVTRDAVWSCLIRTRAAPACPRPHLQMAPGLNRGWRSVSQNRREEGRTDMAKAVNEEKKQFAEERQTMRNDIKQLRKTIQDMMNENNTLPENEKLQLWEFNLDIEEHKRMEAKIEDEVARVRNEMELQIEAYCYEYDVIKRECWDSMKVKGRAIKAFHQEDEVKNYPMKERTQREMEELERVKTLRRIEQADLSIVEDESKTAPQKDEDEGGEEAESPALMGSLSAQCGVLSPDLYNQFELHTREQKINQIILLQDVIHNVKMAFNEEFDAVYKQKEEEMNRVKEKNRRIVEIMGDLGLKEMLWEPTLSVNERPERLFTVDDSEIKVEKCHTPEQKLKAEELAKTEEQRRLAAKGVNARENALDDMMGGVLDLKKEDILKTEIPQPEFMSKPEVQWTEEEKKGFKEYEKKVKELKEEQEKYRKALEAELKKLQTSIKDATQAFDETLDRLAERKLQYEKAICQEELKIANLVYSTDMEEKLVIREKQLNHKLEQTRKIKQDIAEDLKKHKEDVDAFRETYDNTVAEDKLRDRGFRKDFFDVPGHVVEDLYKLFKRRPRVQKMRTENSSPFKDRAGSATAPDEGLSQLMRAMEELDVPENIPQGVDLAVWERFCLARRAKVESEHQVQQKALTLAEMQAFLQRRTEEDDSARKEIQNLTDELNGIRENIIKFQADPVVHLFMKQGQVEVQTGNFIPDYSNCVLIDRSVVEDLNRTIKALGKQKISSMVKTKDIHKDIAHKEWQQKKMQMQTDDLNHKIRDIQMMRVSREMQAYLSETDYDNNLSKQISNMKKTLSMQEKIHKKKVNKVKKSVQQLIRQTAQKAQDSATLDQQLQNMMISVAEKRHICDAIAVEQNQESSAEERYKDILQRKRLVDLAKAQAQEVAILRAEVERLRMKTFPALD
ncbi:cilia- and flagella-associated protein 43 [Amia ocellicauda]|uniref:cilia- and flagella-associated protein 43 n=1 Tax=Amia ocellicauda TaxID=2972642 RepID=UPI00346420F0